jgi:hypothetical protein
MTLNYGKRAANTSSLSAITALSPLAPTAAFAQLHLEIAKAPEQAPKIAIVPFKMTMDFILLLKLT